jgi:hypothetical protein
MKPLGSVEFGIEELPAELKIRYGRNAGWIERSLAPALVPLLIAAGWFWQETFLVVGARFLLTAAQFPRYLEALRRIVSSYKSTAVRHAATALFPPHGGGEIAKAIPQGV